MQGDHAERLVFWDDMRVNFADLAVLDCRRGIWVCSSEQLDSCRVPDFALMCKAEQVEGSPGVSAPVIACSCSTSPQLSYRQPHHEATFGSNSTGTKHWPSTRRLLWVPAITSMRQSSGPPGHCAQEVSPAAVRPQGVVVAERTRVDSAQHLQCGRPGTRSTPDQAETPHVQPTIRQPGVVQATTL